MFSTLKIKLGLKSRFSPAAMINGKTNHLYKGFEMLSQLQRGNADNKVADLSKKLPVYIVAFLIITASITAANLCPLKLLPS